jgi:hypothetical protein
MASRSHGLVPLWALVLFGACCLAARSKKPEDLAAGKILITTRGAPDPLFAESVILLVRYSDSGALGLMVNRRTTLPISDALRQLRGAAGNSDPVFVGGPVELDTVFCAGSRVSQAGGCNRSPWRYLPHHGQAGTGEGACWRSKPERTSHLSRLLRMGAAPARK